MLSSFRNVRAVVRPILLASAISTVLATAAASAAVNTYVVPEIELRAEHHSNLDLSSDTDEKSNVEGYSASAGATLGMRSPRGLTELRPNISYTDFPDRDEFTDANYYFDLKSLYDFQRDKLKLIGHYSKENAVEGEIPDAQFDSFDPANPSQGAASGIVLQKETITKIQLRPEWVHSFSERIGAGVGGIYQTVNFDSVARADRKDNENVQAEGFLVWRLDQRTDLRTGAYRSRFKTDDGSNKTDATGVQVSWQRSWSPTFSGYVSVNAERTETDTEKSNSWGLQVGGFRSGQVSRTELSFGRALTPSFAGSRVELDEFRVQYDRDLSERMVFGTAVRANRSRSQGRVDDDDNEFARGDLELRYLLSRTWYIAGSYSYVWQKFRVDAEDGSPRDGNDNIFGIRVGYAGLRPQ